MVNPDDDDFDDDFDDDPVMDEDDDGLDASSAPSDTKLHDARRRIEDILERRRLREEFGDFDFD